MAVSYSSTDRPAWHPTPSPPPSFWCVIYTLRSVIRTCPFDMKRHVEFAVKKTSFWFKKNCVVSSLLSQKIFGPLFLHTKLSFSLDMFWCILTAETVLAPVFWGQKQFKKKGLTPYQQLQKNNLKWATEVNFAVSMSTVFFLNATFQTCVKIG